MHLLPRLLLLAFASFAASCSGLSKPYPAKEFFALSIPAGAVANVELHQGVLGVEPVRVASPFDQRVFVYRMAGDRLELDYYREFAASPSALLTGEAVRALAGSGRFDTVLAPGSTVTARYSLEASVERMYGDYRDPLRPEAFLAARFFLIDNGPSTATVLGEWTFESTVPFAADRPDALAGALARAWGDVLNRFVSASTSVGLVGPSG